MKYFFSYIKHRIVFSPQYPGNKWFKEAAARLGGRFRRVKTIFSWLLNLGIHDYPEETRRRLRVMNVIAYLIAIATLGYAVQYMVQDFQGYLPLILINIFLVIMALLVPLGHRIHEIFGGLMLTFAEYIAIFVLVSYLGRQSGLQIQYFLGPAAAFLVLGTSRPVWAGFVIGGAIFLNILCWFKFPPESATIILDKGQIDIIYLNAVITTGALIAAAVYYAYAQMQAAQKKVNELLCNSLPGAIVERLKENENAQISDRFEKASVLFMDLAGFTPLAQELGPQKTVEMLDNVMRGLDEIAARYDVEKIKTIGDAYMAVCGVPEIDELHREKIASMALEVLPFIENASTGGKGQLQARIGIASGPVIAGIIGTAKLSYDIWGDTVNLAARMEAHGKTGRIQVSDEFRDALDNKFIFESAGVQAIKGMGRMPVWYLVEKI